MGSTLLPLLGLLCLFVGGVVVDANQQLSVVADERRVIDLGVFGFAEGGKFSLKLEHFFIDDPNAVTKDSTGRVRHNESIGFVLTQVYSAQEARYERTVGRTTDKELRQCFIDDPDFKPRDPAGRFLFSLNGRDLTDLSSTTTVEVTKPGLYALFFYNCKGYASAKTGTGATLQAEPVSFTASMEQYNVNVDGQRNYLSVGDQPKPTVYGLFAFVFFTMTVLWWREMRHNPTYVHAIHRLMLVLLVVKTVTLLCLAFKYGHYASTGTGSVWDFFFYVFATLKGVSLFSIVVLLGTGWSLMKTALSENERRLLMVLLPAQLTVNVCLAVVEETNEGAKGWERWGDLLRIADVVCCCTVILPLVWSINRLRQAASHDETAAVELRRLSFFRGVYALMVGYIYFTRIVLWMVDGMMPHRYWFVSSILTELTAVGFYFELGRRFRPSGESPYIKAPTSAAQAADEGELHMREEVI